MQRVLLFLCLVPAGLAAEDSDFSMRLSRHMIQKLSGLAAGELHNHFWLDLNPHGEGESAGLELNIALPFNAIPGELRIGDQRKPIADMLEPACDQPGEIFESQSCAAHQSAGRHADYKVRVRAPLHARFPSEDSDEFHLELSSRPEVTGCFDADLQHYALLLSRTAQTAASLQAVYNDPRPWSQLRDEAMRLTEELRGLRAVAERFTARSNFYTLPSAALLRQILERAEVRSRLQAALEPASAQITRFEVHDNLTGEIAIEGLSRVFTPWMPELRLNRIRALQLSQPGSEPLECLLLQGTVLAEPSGVEE